MSTATVQPSANCTLADYAVAKKLNPEFLQRLGLRDASRFGRPVLCIPYFAADGSEIAVRSRTSLSTEVESGGRFRWRKGDKLLPYGLWRLGNAKERGFVVIVEGESDAHTLWQHDIPALGLPGANTWREEWAAYVDGIPALFVVIEPDAGGRAAEEWLRKSAIRDRARLVSLRGAKDPSELYLGSPETFLQSWQAAMDAAVPWPQVRRAQQDARHTRAFASCAELASERDILGRMAKTLAGAGVVGEVRVTKLLYLSLTSRLLERPVSAALKGPSSAGKSFLCERSLEFFPESAYYALSAMSEHALAYSVEPLEHRILVLYEAAGLHKEFAAYLMRSLLSENCVRYETVEKTQAGLKSRLIERRGPAGLLVTTTAIHLDPELETRLLSIPVSDSPEQTARVLRSIAGGDRPAIDFRPWHALQEWLEGAEHRVDIPFAMRLVELIPPAAVRLRRDVSAVLKLICAHAILHQKSRSLDETGRIVASLEDYTAVRELVSDLVSEGVGAVISRATRETVEAVSELIASGVSEPTVQAVARSLRLDKSTAWRRVRKALDEGYLTNLEARRGHAARLARGETLPNDLNILPHPEQLVPEDGCTVAPDSRGKDTTLLSHGLQIEGLDARVCRRLAESWEIVPEASSSANGAETLRQVFETPRSTQGDLLSEVER